MHDAKQAPGQTLLIGKGRLADATERALRDSGAEVARLHEPTDPEIRAALEGDVARLVIASRHDHVSLRLALVADHIRPGLEMLVTVFDADVASHLGEAVPSARPLSMADAVAPALAGPLLDPEMATIAWRDGEPGGIVCTEGGSTEFRPASWAVPGRGRRLADAVVAIARPFDSSARILVAGLAGFLVVLVVETIATMLVGHLSLVEAFYTAAKLGVTTGPSKVADDAAAWFQLFSAVAMLLTLGFSAVLTAGLVNRLLNSRLTGIAGRAAVPRRDHVIVVGLGQVGFRLCQLLRELGVPVVAVECNEDAKNVARAKDLRLPVVVASGSSQRALRRVSVGRARAVAAVTSDEVENIAVAVAARGEVGDILVAVRAGDGDDESEIGSLHDFGAIRDVFKLAGCTLAHVALGGDAVSAFPEGEHVRFVGEDGHVTAA